MLQARGPVQLHGTLLLIGLIVSWPNLISI
jgi:hypothetical protein